MLLKYSLPFGQKHPQLMLQPNCPRDTICVHDILFYFCGTS